MSDSEPEVEYEPEEFQIGPFNFTITTISFLPIELLMKNQSKSVEISGQKLWCGSLGVSEYILRHPSFVVGKRIIELGAGTGVLGMLCSKLGASEIILTDNDPRSITHMRSDVEVNQVPAKIVSLDWFHPSIDSLDLPSSSLSSIILAGDVLYKNLLIQPFFTTVRQIFEHLFALPPFEDQSAPSMILCHVPRAGVSQDDVVAGAREQGLIINPINEHEWKYQSETETQLGSLLATCPMEDVERAKLYHVTFSR